MANMGNSLDLLVAKAQPSVRDSNFDRTALKAQVELWGPPHHAHLQIKRLEVLGNHPGHSGDL